MAKEKLTLVKKYSEMLEEYRLYLYHGNTLINTYDLLDINRAKNDFKKFNPIIIDEPVIIAEREV